MKLIIIYILLGIGIVGLGFLFSTLFIYCIHEILDDMYKIDEQEENYYH